MRVSARTLVFCSVGMILATAPAAFAQDPNAYPPQPQPYPQQQPQPYQQQPQQYPQQQYPQQQYPQQYPQQQYPQQQYPQQYPPAGYAAPAPAAPPSSYQQPAYAPPQHTDLRYGGLMILTMGLNVPVGSGSDGYSAGFSLGGLFGGHLSHDISLNGELAINILNHDLASSDESEVLADVAFSPLYHTGQGDMEIVFGPKLGGFGYSLTSSNTDDKFTASGLAYGFNAGIFFQLSRTLSLGGLLNFTGHHTTNVCATYNGVESCGDPVNADDLKLLVFNGAVRW